MLFCYEPVFRGRFAGLLGSACGQQVPGRIFLIGHNKCGTRSFHKLLRKNGYSSIHYDKGRLARRIQANFTFSKPLLDGVDDYCGYTDMELCGEFYAYRFFPLLDLQYPGPASSTTRVT